MDKPVQITFRNIEPSPEVEAVIHERAAALTAYHPHIVGCRVLMDVPHRHQKHGRQVEVRIELSLPGEDLVVRHEPVPHAPRSPGGAGATGEAEGPHQDILVVVRDAFDVVRRRLQDAARRQRGAVKTHETPDRGAN